MDKCQRCGKNSNGYGMVVLKLKENESSILICNRCHNKYMADMLDVNYYEDFERKVIFTDCEDVEHIFQIMNRIDPTGIYWEAVEFIDEDKIGYHFQIHQEFEDDSKETLKRLYDKVEKGLSMKFIKREVSFGREFNSLKDDKAEGRIEWDERYEGNIPKFIIDGKEYSLDELGRMIMSYEGWNFKLEIIEPTE